MRQPILADAAHLTLVGLAAEPCLRDQRIEAGFDRGAKRPRERRC
jgi:hypothetical protein